MYVYIYICSCVWYVYIHTLVLFVDLFWAWHKWNQILRKQNLLLLLTVHFNLSPCLTTLFIFFLFPFTLHHSLFSFFKKKKSCLWPWPTNVILLMGYESTLKNTTLKKITLKCKETRIKMFITVSFVRMKNWKQS